MAENICGIDENGFGPILGPLVITGILADKNIKIPYYIKDSKIIYRNKKDFERIEEIAIILFYILKNRFPESPLDILKSFSVSKCAFEENICEKNIPLNFKIKNHENLFSKYNDLIKEGRRIKKIKVNVICPYFFNEFIIKKNSKFILNLSNFCEIIKDMADYKNVKFFCGKIGGLIYYKKYLTYFFPEYEIKSIQENCNISEYQLFNKEHFFEISFFKNVEGISPLASFSSIIGKYIREIFMESIRKSLNIEEKISGYRDKNTKKIIQKIDFSKFRNSCIIRKV